MHLACRYESPQVNTVVSLTLDIQLADQANTLAVRFRSAQAGLIPLPLKKFLDHIQAAAERADLTLRWAQTEGDPVALITVEPERPAYENQRVIVDTVKLRDGEILLAGRSEELTEIDPSPGKLEPTRETGSQAGENRSIHR
jgi:hypothetical protein